VLKTSRNTLLI